MKLRHAILHLILILSALCGALVSTRASEYSQMTPEQQAAALTAEVFINAYLRAWGEEIFTPEDAVEWVKRHPLATDNFKSRLERLYRDAYEKDPEMGYGADALISAQDSPYEYKVSAVHIEDQRAIVDLEGVNVEGDPYDGFFMRMVLIRPEQFWLVEASGDLVEYVDEPSCSQEIEQ